MLSIRNINENCIEVETNDYIVGFSYGVPVVLEDKATHERYRTAKKWSRTTSKHINMILDGRSAEPLEQDEIDTIVNDI